MCGKLPHVETLSSPDNYSLAFVAKVSVIEIPIQGTQCLLYVIVNRHYLLRTRYVTW